VVSTNIALTDLQDFFFKLSFGEESKKNK